MREREIEREVTEGGLQTSVLIYFETRVLYSVEYMQQLSQPILSRSTFSSTKATHRMASPLSSCPEAHPNLRSHKAPRRPTASATSLLSSSQLSHINAVFTHAGPPPSEPPPKRRRLNVLPDDEEDDFDMIANVDTGAEPESGGGFFPEPSTDGGFVPDTGGGFLMDTSERDSPPPSRIPLHAIPTALQALSLPSSHDLLTLFADAASDDDEGILSVPREKFVEACAVLLGERILGEEEEGFGQEESSGSGDDSEEEYVAEVRGRTGGRRSTRANPGEEVERIVLASSESEAQESGDGGGKGKGVAVAKGRKGKQGPRKKDRDRVLSKDELREAGDTFDLFFEGSSRWDGRRREERTIGLGELKNVAGLLNEKLADEEVRSSSWCCDLRARADEKGQIAEMLEYAGRSGGVVDLEAFTKVLAEAL